MRATLFFNICFCLFASLAQAGPNLIPRLISEVKEKNSYGEKISYYGYSQSVGSGSLDPDLIVRDQSVGCCSRATEYFGLFSRSHNKYVFTTIRPSNFRYSNTISYQHGKIIVYDGDKWTWHDLKGKKLFEYSLKPEHRLYESKLDFSRDGRFAFIDFTDYTTGLNYEVRNLVVLDNQTGKLLKSFSRFLTLSQNIVLYQDQELSDEILVFDLDSNKHLKPIQIDMAHKGQKITYVQYFPQLDAVSIRSEAQTSWKNSFTWSKISDDKPHPVLQNFGFIMVTESGKYFLSWERAGMSPLGYFYIRDHQGRYIRDLGATTVGTAILLDEEHVVYSLTHSTKKQQSGIYVTNLSDGATRLVTPVDSRSLVLTRHHLILLEDRRHIEVRFGEEEEETIQVYEFLPE